MFRLERVRSEILLPAIMLLVVFVSGCNQTSEPAQTNSAAPAASPTTSTATANTNPAKKLNVNTASESELLAAIPGLGNRMVHEFEEYRPYRSIQQFRKEIGKYVDQQKVAEYEQYIFVPIDPNQADAATLQQIPGLDNAEAEALIAGRPYASPQAFLTRLEGKVTPTDLEAAKLYLGIS